MKFPLAHNIPESRLSETNPSCFKRTKKRKMATLQFSLNGESPPGSISQNKQLLNHIVDGTAKIRPSAVYAEVPRSSDSYEQGYRSVTYRAFANAINGVAWWLHDKLGSGQNHQTLAYLGPNDLSYVIMILGAVKAGYKVSGES